jgi:hypothetical protein
VTRRLLSAALAVLLVAGQAACSSGGDGATSPVDREPEASSGGEGAEVGEDGPTTPPPVELPDDAVVRDVGTSFQFGSFLITVGTVAHLPTEQQLRVGLRFRNISGGWSQTDTTAQLELPDGTTVPLSGDLFDVPPGASVAVTSVGSPVASDPFDGGTIRWGGSAYQRPAIRLDPEEGDRGEGLWLPVAVPVDRWAQIGRFGVHLTHVEVHASQIDLGIQAPEGQRVVRTHVESYTTKGTTTPFDARNNLVLALPDGTEVQASDGSTMANQLSWTSQGGQWADFLVPDDAEGRLELRLGSPAIVGFSTVDAARIERRPIPFELVDLEPGELPVEEPLVAPGAYPTPVEGAGEAFETDLDAGSINVPGYDLRPTRLSYDPATLGATLEATVTPLAAAPDGDDEILAADPTFGLRLALLSGGRLAAGVVGGTGAVDPVEPTELTFEFSGVRALDPADAGLYVGAGEGAVASLPLGPASPVVSWPPTLEARDLDAPPIVTGDWTVQLLSYRLGLVDPVIRPNQGRRQLEVALDVTASPTASPGALGLSFVPLQQLLLGSGTGYDQGAVADSGLFEWTPGETRRLRVTFDVADSFRPGRLAFSARSRAEFAQITEWWAETRFEAALTTTSATEEFG